MQSGYRAIVKREIKQRQEVARIKRFMVAMLIAAILFTIVSVQTYNMLQEHIEYFKALEVKLEEQAEYELSTDIYLRDQVRGLQEEVLQIQQTFNSIDLLKRVNKTLQEAVDGGHLIQ